MHEGDEDAHLAGCTAGSLSFNQRKDRRPIRLTADSKHAAAGRTGRRIASSAGVLAQANACIHVAGPRSITGSARGSGNPALSIGLLALLDARAGGAASITIRCITGSVGAEASAVDARLQIIANRAQAPVRSAISLVVMGCLGSAVTGRVETGLTVRFATDITGAAVGLS